MFISDNGPHQEGGARSGVLQELGRAARDQARSLRGRHPRADDRAMARHDPGRPRQQPRLGALGHASRRSPSSPARRRPPASTACRWRARCAAEPQPDPRLLLLGIPRARLPAGGADGALEGGAAEARRAAGALQSRCRTCTRTHDVAAAHPDIVAQIEAYLKTARTPSERWPGK